MKAAGDLLSWLDPMITASLIVDAVGLYRYREESTCTCTRLLLMKLIGRNDVQSFLIAKKKLITKPEIAIKPAMSVEVRRAESLLLKERRSLIDSGTKRSDIKYIGAKSFNTSRMATLVA